MKAKAVSSSESDKPDHDKLSSCDEMLAEDSDEDNPIASSSPIKDLQINIKPFQIRRLQNSLFLDGPINEKAEKSEEPIKYRNAEQQREDEA